MLVQFVEPKWSNEFDNWDYDEYHVISAFDVKDYQRFIKFIETMKGRECVLNNKWYTVDSYTTMAPFFRFLPTISEADTTGVKSGVWS